MAHIHFIGISGTGLSAIARVLLESGYTVSGSDRQITPLAESLQAAGARVSAGHRAENIAGADAVVCSSAVPDDNVEVQAAQKEGIPVYKRAEFLGTLMQNKVGVAVAGSHGKTTTTAMIAWMLHRLGQDPSYIIGGVSKNLGANAHSGKGQLFVIEADEYDRMFLGLQPWIEIVTNIEYDHPDCFPTVEDYRQAFLEFIQRLPKDGVLLANQRNEGAAWLLEKAGDQGRMALGYGILPQDALAGEHRFAYQAKNLKANSLGGFSFTACVNLKPGEMRLDPSASAREEQPQEVHLRVPGKHNASNALAALAVASQLGFSLEKAAEALGEYQGTGRRFDILGEAAGITVIDDYAHHPSEIRATLDAARARFPGSPLWVVWQPHTYSRTRALFDEFAASFKDADHVLVTEIYAAREPVEAGFSAVQVVKALQHPDAHFSADLNQATIFLLERLQTGDVLLVLSAGDADQISARVMAALKERSR